MPTFEELAASRRQWIEEVLRPWCRAATYDDLRRAELEWGDIAGRVDAEATLWTWAWSRFPDLVHDEMSGVNETSAVAVTFRDGTVVEGYPDARQSRQGQLVLLTQPGPERRRFTEHGPHSIDEIVSVTKL